MQPPTLLIVLILLLSPHQNSQPPPVDFYVAPYGDDTNPGTIDRPFKTITKAYYSSSPGNLIYFRGGKYEPTIINGPVAMDLARNNQGSQKENIKFWAYPGEKPVINLSSIQFKGGTIWGVLLSGNYMHWKGFEITGLPAIASQWVHCALMLKDCNNCIFENLTIHDNNGLGLVLGGNSSNNLIVNCDAYNNQDPLTSSDPYGNADGFHIGVINNPDATNTLRNCRAWYNSDDGFDCYNNEGTVIFENCWAFFNGYKPETLESAGDGDGFKLGNSQKSYKSIKRILKGCISARNKLTGIDLNDGMFEVQLEHCLCYKNGNHGIYINKYNMANNIINCISFDNGSGYNALISKESSIINCSWQGFNITQNSFVNTDIQKLRNSRNIDNDLPINEFLKLSPSSNFKFKKQP